MSYEGRPEIDLQLHEIFLTIRLGKPLTNSQNNINLYFKFISRNEKQYQLGDNFTVEESLDLNPEENPNHFVAILVKSLCLLEKLPFAINVSINSKISFKYCTIKIICYNGN